MEVSNAFVVLMGMGITFIGLTCIIFLTILMGKVMQGLDKKPSAQETPAPPATPAAPADGVSEEVKVAILMALLQDPAFRLESVQSIDIRRA